MKKKAQRPDSNRPGKKGAQEEKNQNIEDGAVESPKGRQESRFPRRSRSGKGRIGKEKDADEPL